MVFGKGSIVRGIGEPMFEDGTWERLDFGEADGSPAKRVPSDRGGFHAGTDGEVTHRRLEAVDDVEEVWAVGQQQDIQGQR